MTKIIKKTAIITALSLVAVSLLSVFALFVFAPKKAIPYRVVVVDEISMLPKEMWELLMSHGVHPHLFDQHQLAKILLLDNQST